ncbi:MAG: DUF4180 domain-containing protein [Bacteroidales bacterium]
MTRLETFAEKKIFHVEKGEMTLNCEQDAVDMAALCGENDTNLILVGEGVAGEEFFDLKTGVAGAVLQKFSNYRIKAAFVIDREKARGRFAEMASESNRHGANGFFFEENDARKWLVSR